MILVQLIGNLGRDAEVKPINDKQYLSFSVASTEKRNNEETTTWVSVLYPYQEALLPFLKKGQQVFVSGRLKAGIYQNQQSFGIDLSVFAQTLQLCGSKKEEAPATQAPVSTLTPKHPEANAGVNNQEWMQQAQHSPFPTPEEGQNADDNLPF